MWETDDYSNMDWEIDWDTPSGYTPTNEYVRPWDVEGWGAGDVEITPPRNPGGYVPPSRPGIQEGQRDYVFMPTEKEQWRIEDENKRRQALAVGKDWKEARLPYTPTEKEKIRRFNRNRERREVSIQPVPRRDREWGESRPGEGYIQVEGPGNPSWERRNPREREVTIQPVPKRENRRPSLRDTLMRDMGSNRGLSSDRDRISMLTGRW
tara:strand:+ start:7437 stop:8063 length:627 start_codon:yes stop_codon:yes gene_type:complete